MKHKKIKFIFIINDDSGKALDFVSKYRISKKGNNISFDKGKNRKDIRFDDELIKYDHYFKGLNGCKCLFFDGCIFGDTNNLSHRDIIAKLSNSIKQNGETKDVEWAFIRIQDYDGKKQTIGNLLAQYEKTGKQEEQKEDAEEKTNNKTPSVSVYFMNFGKTIILNECFIDSRYTIFGNNITHEVINCFEADGHERYFYLCSQGSLSEDRFERESSQTLPKQYINEKKLTYLEYSKAGQNDDGKTQYVFLRKTKEIEIMNAAFEDELNPGNYANVNYGGVNICEIFSGNAYSREQNDDSMDGQLFEDGDDAIEAKSYVTFKAKKAVYVPQKQEQAVVQSDEELRERLKGTTMRQFVIEGSPFYDDLIDKIKNIEWKEEDVPTFKEYEKTASKDDIPDSILGIIGREKKENYYSDLFAYLFSKFPSALNAFLGKAGVEHRVDPGFYVVERETKNMDILIKNNKKNNQFLVVIENKVLATFNFDEKKKWDECISSDSRKKHKTTIDELKEKDTEYRKSIAKEKGNKDSQLSKYYLLARYIAKINGFPDDEHVNCLIICPEAYVKAYDSKKGDFAYGERYKVCSYKAIDEAIAIEGKRIDETIKKKTDDERELAEKKKQKAMLMEISNCLAPHIIKTDNFYISRNRLRFFESVMAKQKKSGKE